MTEETPPEVPEAEERDNAADLLAVLRRVNNQPNGLQRKGDRVSLAFNQQGQGELREVKQDLQIGERNIPIFLAVDGNNTAYGLSIDCDGLRGAADNTLRSAAGMMVMGIDGSPQARRELRSEIHSTLMKARDICKP
jgi:hypothetical protein